MAYLNLSDSTTGQERKPYRLDEVAKVIDSLHKSPTYQPHGIPMVRVTDVKPGFLDLSNTVRVSEDIYQEFIRNGKPNRGNIVFSRVGTYGIASFVNTDEPFCLGQNTALIVPRINARYLFYCLQSPFIKRQIEEAAVGSTQKTISLKNIKALSIPNHKEAEIKAIAHILGTLDDKIELNRRMNETLEAMARALFKSWFVDFDPVRAKAEKRQPAGMDAETAALFPASFEESSLGLIPRGWRVATLDDITESALGGDWGNDASAEDASDAALCIRGADIPDLQKASVGKMPVRYLKHTSLQKRHLQDGDLVIEISGGSPTQSTGRPVLVTKDLLEQLEYPLVCSNFCRMVRLSSNASPIFAYLWLRWLYASDAFLQYENGTTGIKNFAFSIFSKQFYLALPPPELLKEFEGQVGLLFKKQATNGAQSRTLATMRDALLPKLLSGEIRVRDAEREVGKSLEHARA